MISVTDIVDYRYIYFLFTFNLICKNKKEREDNKNKVVLFSVFGKTVKSINFKFNYLCSRRSY